MCAYCKKCLIVFLALLLYCYPKAITDSPTSARSVIIEYGKEDVAGALSILRIAISLFLSDNTIDALCLLV